MTTLRSWRAAAGGFPAAGAPTSGTDDGPQGVFERIVIPAIVVTYAVGMPVWSFGRVLAGPHRPSAAGAGAAAMACSVVLQLWLLVPVARGRRPRHAGWLIAAFAAINVAAFPLIGAAWFAAGEQIAVLAAVYLRPRWSVPAVAVLAAVPAAMAAAGHDVTLDRYFAQNTVFWALTMGVLIWLARLAARLRASRQELVGSAVIAERVRIDDELGASLGAELEQLIAAGKRAARAADDDPAAAERELRALTGAARSALAQTRRMVSRYQAITVRSELSTAVALLDAAGIRADVDVPSAVLGQPLDGERLAGFRSGLTTVLRDQAPGGCLITTDGEGGGLRLAIRRVDREPR
jgi:two-component system, NarL family, sensor histidine kinase DesK